MTMVDEPADRVVLPASGGGERRNRRARKRAQRRRLIRIVLVGLLVAAVLGVAAVVVLRDRGTAPVDEELLPVTVEDTEEPPAAPIDDPPRALVVHQSDGGAVVGVTVLAAGPTGEGGSVVFLPAGSMVEVPSFGIDALRDAHSLGGLALLQSSVENLLGLSFDAVAAVGPTQLAAALEPVGVLTVDVPSPVESVSPEGRVTVLWGAGPQAVAPDEAAAFLEAPGQGSDLDRLVRHQRFWEAWLAALDGEAPPRAALGAVGPVVAGLSDGDVRYDVLPVEAVASGPSAEADLWSVKDEELAALVGRVAPEASPAEARIRVQVLNGTGDVGVAQVVQPLLVPAGASVALTGNADRFDYATTQVVFYDDADRAAADAVRAALGVGEVVKSLTPLSVVDVTVVVGADLLERRGA